MASRYLRLREVYRELLRQGKDEDAKRVYEAIKLLLRAGKVSNKEKEAGFYL